VATTLVRQMAFKDSLRRLRLAAGMTQQELATAAGLAVSAVAQLEVGRIGDPKFSTVRALAKALGCTPNDLVGEEEEPPPRKRRRK